MSRVGSEEKRKIQVKGNETEDWKGERGENESGEKIEKILDLVRRKGGRVEKENQQGKKK